MGSYGPPPKKYLCFKKLPRRKGQVTDRWVIRSHQGERLGVVRFYPQWRCYVAKPVHGAVWSANCDRERAVFTEARTNEWRKSKLPRMCPNCSYYIKASFRVCPHCEYPIKKPRHETGAQPNHHLAQTISPRDIMHAPGR